MNPFQDRLAQLELTFAELGFERVAKLAQAAWCGRLKGRECLVTVAPQGRTRYAGEVRVRQRIGYRLRVELETSVRTRLFFVRQAIADNGVVRWIYRLKKQAVVTPSAELDGFKVVAREAPWAQRLLGEGTAMTAVGELLRDNATAAFAGSVYFGPTIEAGKVYYASPVLQLEDLTPERSLRVIERLLTVAEAAERLPPLAIPCHPSRFERLGQKHPVLIVLGFFGCALAVLGAAALLFLALALLLSR